jgi:predicted transcriptional regulator
MAIDTTDVRSNANVQIMHAVDVIYRSEDRRKVFEEIYRGKSNGKTAEEIASKINIDKVRVLQEALVLCKTKIVKKEKIRGRLTYLKDDFFSQYKEKILRLATDKLTRENFRAKLNPTSSSVVVKLPSSRKTIDIKHLTIDEIDSFEKVVNVGLAVGTENSPILEETFKKGLQRILSERGVFKDWGGEGDDLFSTRLILNGKRIPVAFGLKGRGTKGKLTPKKLGKQGDQIQRLFRGPAEVFLIQYWDQIAESVSEQMKLIATAKSVREGKRIYYGEIDGQDTLRILKAYPEYFENTDI